MTGQSSNIVYAMAVQTDATTPATGAFTSLQRRSGSFTSEVSDIDDGEQSSGRLADAPGAGQKTHSGNFETSFRELILDDLLRSAFASDWVANGVQDVLSLGKAPVYFTFVVETPYLNDTTRQYTRYVGCTVSSINLDFPQDGYIGMTIDLSAANKTYETAAPWTTLVDSTNKQKLRTCNALESLMLATKDGDPLVEVSSIVNTLDFSLTNETEELFDIRQCDPKEITLGSATIEGNINAYHDDDSDQWHRDADQAEEAKMRFFIQGETTTYRFDVPRMTNKSPGIDPSGTTVGVNLPFGVVSETPTITRFPN